MLAATAATTNITSSNFLLYIPDVFFSTIRIHVRFVFHTMKEFEIFLPQCLKAESYAGMTVDYEKKHQEGITRHNGI